MANVSISLVKGDPKTKFATGTAAPTSGKHIELRIDDSVWSSEGELFAALEQLVGRLREIGKLSYLN